MPYLKFKIVIFVSLLAALAVLFFILNKKQPSSLPNTLNSEILKSPDENLPLKQETKTPEEKINPFVSPLENSGQRITKKNFGDFITPSTSPVQPEKFSGYHTGVDFEILPGEETADILVKAVCDGKLVYKNQVNGYGGVAVQECLLKDETATVLYGHLKLSSVNLKIGDEIKTGGIIGILGAGYSSETDGERKHLHLALHFGSAIELRGYVQGVSDLKNWLNPCDYGICQ